MSEENKESEAEARVEVQIPIVEEVPPAEIATEIPTPPEQQIPTTPETREPPASNIGITEEERIELQKTIEKSGNKTIEKKGDTITITEVMAPITQPVAHTTPTTFPAPFKQPDLWKKFLEKLDLRKKKRLEKIIEFLNKNQKIANDEVEKLLHVSDSTATRYLDILERENKIKQVGKTGKYTYYTKI